MSIRFKGLLIGCLVLLICFDFSSVFAMSGRWRRQIIAQPVKKTAPSRPAKPVVTAQAQSSPLGLNASWTGGADVVEYQYQITQESRHEGYDVVATAVYRDWTSTGTNASIIVTDLIFYATGPYRVSIKARNSSGLWSDIAYSNDVFLSRTTPLPPAISFIAPSSGTTFLAGSKIYIQVAANDFPNHLLEYQFLIAGRVVQDWIHDNVYNWQTSAADVGLVPVTFNIRDREGLTTTRTVSYRIINPTVEEILQKVADNYALIYDFKADMLLSSTLDNKPFGDINYCRYYFKAPNKEKTDTFSGADRITKTDSIIIDGSTMHLFDPIKNIKQDVDLLADSGLTNQQFSQVDIYYNQALFLGQHSITKNNAKLDQNYLIVYLDVLPNSANNIYDKLIIAVDYAKGIIMKYSIYKKNPSGELALVQETNTVECRQMPNGAWLPIKMTKIPNLTAGNLVSTMAYSNVQVNTGLTDAEFDPTKQ